MRDLLSRLEKLEAKAAPMEPIRIVWHVIDVLPGGGPALFDPQVAYCPGEEGLQLERGAGERLSLPSCAREFPQKRQLAASHR